VETGEHLGSLVKLSLEEDKPPVVRIVRGGPWLGV
jgi:hypothetical protein